MNEGDLVRLKQPFQPTPSSPRKFQFGIIAAIVTNGSQAEPLTQNIQLIVYLYDPQTATTFQDEWGEAAPYCFALNEVDWIGALPP